MGDGGQVRGLLPGLDPGAGSLKLELGRISRRFAKQRAGPCPRSDSNSGAEPGDMHFNEFQGLLLLLLVQGPHFKRFSLDAETTGVLRVG